MPIPPYDALMLPVLKHCAQKTWLMRDLINQIANDLALTAEERAQMIPSGGTPLIANRVHWAKTYLKKAGLLTQPKRGTVEISERGRSVLSSVPDRIDIPFLRQFAGFGTFLAGHKAEDGETTVGTTFPPIAVSPSSTPEEQIADASNTINDALRDAVLARLLEASPAFFERAIIDLLLAMGYGGSKTDAGEHLGGTGDGGVDGVIREDQLGLDRIYLQAKRYQPGNTVTSEAVQAFIGALIGKGAQKGVFITTSSFSKSALNAAAAGSLALRLVLIDGSELTNLMLRFNVGVRVARTVEIKRIDLDYFEESETE